MIEDDDRPRKPGEVRVEFAGEPREGTFDFLCPDCHNHVKGFAVNYGPPKYCSMHGEIDCDPLHYHWSSWCPAWKNRWWRLTHRYTWDKLVMRRKHRKWQKSLDQEKKDPNAWLRYWEEGGE
jgi:hypothetical protein